MLFRTLCKPDVEEGLGAGGVTGAADSVGAGNGVEGGLVVRAACSVALIEVVCSCASIGVTTGKLDVCRRLRADW